MKHISLACLSCTVILAFQGSALAQGTRTWDRQHAELVLSKAKGSVNAPAPPIGPGFSSRIDSDYDSDPGNLTRALQVDFDRYVGPNPPVWPDLYYRGLLRNNEDLQPTWKLYGGGDPLWNDDRAILSANFASTSPNSLFASAMYYHDFINPYPDQTKFVPHVVGGRWKLVAPDRTHASIHWEYSYGADVTEEDAYFMTYHWGSFSIKRKDPNRAIPRPTVNAFEVWHSGLTMEYKYWKWFGGFPGFPAMPMGDSVFYAVSLYGGEVVVDSFVPDGVDNSEVLDLDRADLHDLGRVIIPGVEYIAVTQNKPTVNASGYTNVLWKLEVTAVNAYAPPGGGGGGLGGGLGGGGGSPPGGGLGGGSPPGGGGSTPGGLTLP